MYIYIYILPMGLFWYCKVLGVPVFLLTLFFGRHVWTLLGFSGPHVLHVYTPFSLYLSLSLITYTYVIIYIEREGERDI